MPPDVTCVASTLTQRVPSASYTHKHKQASACTLTPHLALSSPFPLIITFTVSPKRPRRMGRKWQGGINALAVVSSVTLTE